MNLARHIRRYAGAVAALTFAAPAAHAWPDLAVSGDAGTLGIGSQAAVRIAPWLNARFAAHLFGYSTPVTVNGLDYDGSLQLSNFGGFADIYPFFSSAHVSMGLMYNGNHIDLHKDCPLGCAVNGYTVAGPNVAIDGSIRFNSYAPYVGLGWGNAMVGRPFFVSFDAGVMFQGTPITTLNASGNASVMVAGRVVERNVNLASDPSAQSELDSQRQGLADAVKDYCYYPVVTLAVGWRF